MAKSIKGAFPVLITPMDQQQEVDWGGLQNNIEYFVEQGVAGICVIGSTGEFVSLTKEERLKICESVIKQVNGRIPVIVGTAAETTKETIEYTQHAESVGADMALIINSYYCHPTEEELYHHYKDINDAVSLPIMLYNNPFTSGVDMSTELMLRIGRECDTITHVKESSGDIRKVRDLTRMGEGFIETFCGADDMAMESFLVGATGWISVAGNTAPELVTEMFEAVERGDFDKAWQINDRLLPLCRFLEESGKYVQITKRAMEIRGQAGGPSRAPRRGLTADEEDRLNILLDNLEVLSPKQ